MTPSYRSVPATMKFVSVSAEVPYRVAAIESAAGHGTGSFLSGIHVNALANMLPHREMKVRQLADANMQMPNDSLSVTTPRLFTQCFV